MASKSRLGGQVSRAGNRLNMSKPFSLMPANQSAPVYSLPVFPMHCVDDTYISPLGLFQTHLAPLALKLSVLAIAPNAKIICSSYYWRNPLISPTSFPSTHQIVTS